MWLSGASIRLTPPARAMSHSPRRRLWHARWVDTADELHAVFSDTAGPLRPRAKDTRPAGKLPSLPLPA